METPHFVQRILFRDSSLTLRMTIVMKKVLFTLTMTLALVTLAGCTAKKGEVSTIPTSNLAKGAQIAQIPPEALKNALNTFTKTKESGADLAKGPCLGTIAPDWVLDIAHNPRQVEDDKKENQCQDYLEGKTHHFIEMDAGGQLIQAR